MDPYEIDLHIFLSGGSPGPFRIGRLDSDLLRHIGAGSPLVYLYREGAQKLRFKHRLLLGHFLQIPLAFKYGWVGQDRDRHLSFIYEDEVVYHKAFLTVVKSTGEGHELIAASVYKLQPTDIRRIKRRSTQIRPAKE